MMVAVFVAGFLTAGSAGFALIFRVFGNQQMDLFFVGAFFAAFAVMWLSYISMLRNSHWIDIIEAVRAKKEALQ